jgi:hypothetical protein
MTIAILSKSSIKGTLTTTGDGGDASFPVDELVTKEVTNGTGAGQANAVYVRDFSIAASGSLELDLASSLEDRLGNTLVFTAVKEIFIQASSSNTNNVVVGNGTDPFVGPFSAGTITISLKPGASFKIDDGYSAAGWSVGAGASDDLKLANSGAGSSVAGTIVIVGEA